MTPEQEEEVRRALAAAPAEAPMPPEVVARLDATLADLVAERPTTAAPAPLDELEDRRRRRWPRVLVAAASVSVLAYGAGVALNGLQVSGGGDATTARDGSIVAEDEAGGQAAPELARSDAPVPGSTDSRGYLDSTLRADQLLSEETVELDSSTLGEDVDRLLRTTASDRGGPAAASGKDESLSAFLAGCAVPDTARGDRVAAARLDGRRATLVVRTAVSGARVAEVYSCDEPSRLLTFTRVRPVR